MTPMDKVKQVNEILKSGEPHNISEENRNNGQTYTGYGPQYIIDAMNEVFGLGEWGFDEISNEMVDVPTKSGSQVRAIAQVRVWIKGVEFKPTAYGQANVTMGDLGDAKKGAQTDAIKKGLSYFSVGNRAYRGILPPKPKPNCQNRTAQRPPSQPTSSDKQHQDKRAETAPTPSQTQNASGEQPVAKPTSPTEPKSISPLNMLYERARKKGLFKCGKDAQMNVQNFLKWCSQVCGVVIESQHHMTQVRIESCIKYLDAHASAGIAS